MPKPRTIYFGIPVHEVRSMGVDGALDMLRYDGARVESNPPPGYFLFSITRTDGNEPWPTVRRWESFGVKHLMVWKDGERRVLDFGTPVMWESAR